MPAPREPVSEAGAILSLIERAAVNPAVDIDKMERLFEMQKQAQARAARADYDAALALMQPELPVIDERGKISTDRGKTVQSTYALWEDINEAIKPILAKFGFALTFRVKNAPGVVSITGVLGGHGHREETTLDLPIDSSGSKNGVQAVGSSTSYGQRYTAKLLLNLTSRGIDDDGKSAGASEVGQRAIADINACEGPEQLRAWKAKTFDGLSKMLAPNELREVIELYNRRIKAAKESSGAQDGERHD
jgi:hypothetical protein